MKPAPGSRSIAFRLRIRPDLAAHVVGSFPWDPVHQRHVLYRIRMHGLVMFG